MSMKITDLNGVQKAAILLITLGPDKASNVFKHLKEDVEELDETIDTIIEQANEPSDYEYYCSQDNIRHYENLRGV